MLFVSLFLVFLVLGSGVVVAEDAPSSAPVEPAGFTFSGSFSIDLVPQPAVASEADQKLAAALRESPLLSGLSFYVLGFKDADADLFLGKYGLTTVFIMFFLVWLILFVTFSDILSAFGAFQNAAVSWVVGGALSIIAANLKVVQLVVIWLVGFTLLFGALSVFAGILLAFLAFLAISWGGGGLARWALDRRQNISAHRGAQNVAQGAGVMGNVGAQVANQGQQGEGWWIPLAVAAVMVLIVLTIISTVG